MSSRFLVAALVTGALVAPASASASESRSLEHVSTGGNGPSAATYKGSSADGTRVFFQTAEALSGTDTDTVMDIYERSAGTTTHISTGPTGGNGAFNAVLNAVSDDGSKVLLRTAEKLVSADTDGNQDLYMRSAGTTTLVSTGPLGGNGAFSVIFDGMSADGSRVFFETLEPLVSSDTDFEFDLYERSGSTTTLLSTGPAGGNGEYEPTFEGSSRDGSRVFLTTYEPLTNSDTDPSIDVYQRSGGVTTHLSIGPAGGNGDAELDYDASFDGASADGTKVWLHTTEQLTSDDTDQTDDVYERSGATISRISLGPAGGNAEIGAFFDGSSDDGSRVFFDTTESLVSADTDTSIDVYERAGGQTNLMSTGPDGGNGGFAASFQSASSDGAKVLFRTTESLVIGDTDTQPDLYERSAGQTTWISTSPTGGNAAWPANFNGSSRDGARVYFTTAEALDPADTDGLPDIYQRYAGDTTRVSSGPTGGNGAFFVTFNDVSADGTRVFFETAEPLTGSDTDTSQDVYGSATALSYVRPKGAYPFRASLVPAYQACTTGNLMHGAPLAYSSCNPPVQTSGFLTMGSPDANNRQANAAGQAKYVTVNGNAATPADEADLSAALTLTDVRRKADLADYTGELQFVSTFRITDRRNGSAPVDPATVTDFDFKVTAPCTATADANVGSTCEVSTTADTLMPGAIAEGKRTIIQLTQVKVFDGGADGLVSTSGNTLFAIQGIFVP